MIREVTIRNFRSIKEASFAPTALSALVGPNNVGKSNILRAINVILGPKWPPYAVGPDDKNRDLRDQPIEIRLRFDRALRKDYYGTPYDVWGVVLRYQAADDADFLCLDEDGDTVLVGKYQNPLKVDNEVRGQIPSLLVEAQRDLEAELRAGEWTFLGRILRTIERELLKETGFDAEFGKRASDLSQELLRKPVQELERILNDEMSAISGFHELRLSFEPPDLIGSLKAIRVHVRERPDLPVTHAEDLGQGLQSALVVALVRAYQRLHHVNPVLLLEEPEAFLHPQARRAFHSLLTKTSGECQVLFSTHASEFVEVTRPEGIILVRKDRDHGTTIVQGNTQILTPDERTELKVVCEVDERMREALFSTCAIVCEGEAEANSLPIALRRGGMDPDREGWTLLSAGSKNSLPFVLRLYGHFQIPTVAVFDEDRDKPDYVPVHKPLNVEIEKLVGSPTRCWISDPDFERAHRIPAGESKPRAAVKWAREMPEAEARRLAESLAKAIMAATVPKPTAGASAEVAAQVPEAGPVVPG